MTTISPESIAQCSGELICLADQEGYFRWLNPRWCEHLGWSSEELMARPFVDFIHPDDVESTLAETAKLSTGERTVDFENRYRCKEGGYKRLSWNAVLEGDLFVAVARDVTERWERDTHREENYHRLLQAMDISGVGYWRVDLINETLFWSDEVYRIHGRERALFTPDVASGVDAYHPDDRAAVREALASAIAAGSGFDFELRLIRTDGAVRNVHSRGRVEVKNGQPVSILGTFQDVTARYERERSLRILNSTLQERMGELQARTRELEQLSALADLLQCAQSEEEVGQVLSLQLPEMFSEFSGSVYVVQASRRTAVCVSQWGGEGQIPVIGMTDCWALRRGGTHRVAGRGLRCAHQHREDTDTVCYLLMAQGESLGVLTLDCAPGARHQMRSKDRFAVAVADQLALAIANVRLRASLREQSTRDPLTGMPNRRAFDEGLEREHARAERSGESMSIVMVDIDHFKSFNDDYGHQVADRMLVRLGRLLQGCCRQSDTVARWGGEEFAFLLPATDTSEAGRFMERVHDDVRRLRLEVAGVRCRGVTISAGVASFPDDGVQIESLIAAADRALYRAKEGGRNQTVSCSSTSPALEPA